MMKNIDVAIWYNLYFFLKFQLIMSQIQRKFPLFHGRTWGCKLLLSKKWQYLQIPFFFSPYIQTQNLTFFMKQSVLPPSDWNDGSLFWIFCGSQSMIWKLKCVLDRKKKQISGCLGLTVGIGNDRKWTWGNFWGWGKRSVSFDCDIDYTSQTVY